MCALNVRFYKRHFRVSACLMIASGSQRYLIRVIRLNSEPSAKAWQNGGKTDKTGYAYKKLPMSMGDTGSPFVPAHHIRSRHRGYRVLSANYYISHGIAAKKRAAA
jgi:hypothetical protein